MKCCSILGNVRFARLGIASCYAEEDPLGFMDDRLIARNKVDLLSPRFSC